MRVSAWNRSAIEADARHGTRMLASPVEAFDADAVFTMPADAAAIRATILDGGSLSLAR